MGTQIKSWQVIGGELRSVDSTLSDQGRTENFDLESWIASEPSIVSADVRILGRQVMTESGPLDLLGLDRTGNLVIIELKRDQLPRQALAQAVDYASDVSSWDVDKISEICIKYSGKSLDEFISDEFPEENLEALSLNAEQRIILVGFSIESALERMIQWLSGTYEMSINAVLLHYLRTQDGSEVVSRTAVISEELAEQRSKVRKFKIPMSDEPGTYEEHDLTELLTEYLSKKRVTSDSIREVLLPACLDHQTVQRDLLKQELVDKGFADDITKAGFHLSVLSGQIGMEKNAFLRQVISYDYPNYPWEKDNYRIREGKEEVVRKVLQALAARKGE